MRDQTSRSAVSDALQQINRTWLEGRPRDLGPFLHPSIVMVLPGFSGRVEGAEAVIAGFVDFCENAEMQEYGESEVHIDVTGHTAVASYAFEMLYKRSGASYRSTGRDLWLFTRQDGEWLAFWRTMLDLSEHRM
jgi:hypothetical protein